MSKNKRIKSFSVEKNGKLQVLIDGKPIDLTDIASIDIHIEYGIVTLNTERIEHFRFADKDTAKEGHMPTTRNLEYGA